MHSARLVFALALLPLAACSLRGPGSGARPTAPMQPSAADSGFVTQAAAAGLADLQEAQLAAERAQGAAIKQFARQLVADQASLGQQLSALALRKTVAVPAQPDAQALDQLRELERLHRGFDAQYVRDQLAAQQQAVTLFRQEAEQGADPDIRTFARENLPLVQQHLAMAEALDGQPVAERL